ncbi:hypothetical protein HMSSN139_23850 [Paenibacillus sp. HMSSN-139]|nr:hypothetical protein HMSSN139_23850 [Paenibacillus sp. HMSSN-139]
MQTLWLLIASLLLEIIQYVLALGSSDIDDVLLNTMGGVIGIGIYRWFRKKNSLNQSPSDGFDRPLPADWLGRRRFRQDAGV